MLDATADLVSLGIETRLVENTLGGAVIEVMPTGILPFGSLLGLETRRVRGLSEGDEAAGNFRLLSAFHVSEATRETIADIILENFQNDEQLDTEPASYEPSQRIASWGGPDAVLSARLPFDEPGEIGRFIPVPHQGEDTSRATPVITEICMC